MNLSDLGNAAASFASVAGTLAGFCFAMVTFLLTVPVSALQDGVRDRLVALSIVATGAYIGCAGFLSNAIWLREPTSIFVFNSSVVVFHLANVTLCAIVTLASKHLAGKVATRACLAVLTIIAIVAGYNVFSFIMYIVA